MFSASPKLKTTDRKEPRGQATPGVPKVGQTDGDKRESFILITIRLTKLLLLLAEPQPAPSHKTTVEDADDEDAPRAPKKKKKKKPKKKNKPASVQVAMPDDPAVLESPPSSPVPAMTTTTTTEPGPAPAMASAPPVLPTSSVSPSKTPSTPTRPAVRPPSINASTTTLAHASTTSLPIEPTAAQSARSYLQAEKLDAPKSKVKSRPEPTSLEPIPEKKDFFSKFTKTKLKQKPKEPEVDQKASRQSWFSRLTKRTKGYMSQLLGSSEDEAQGRSAMKWEEFLKVCGIVPCYTGVTSALFLRQVMHDMGFSYDPSTAGSSVRFDPPDKRDKVCFYSHPVRMC